MSHGESVRVLATLFRANNSARPIALLGAGTSFSSGVPLAAECVRRIAKRHYAEKVLGGSIVPERIKLGEWQDWLQCQSWFIADDDRLAENFPLIIEHLLVPREYRKRVLLELMRPAAPIGKGYRELSQIVLRGLVQTLLTTNIDRCLRDALAGLRGHLPYVAQVHRSPDDFREFSIYPAHAQIVWLHGTAEQYSDCNLVKETEYLNPALVARLRPVLAASPLVVVGYRGAEPSIMNDLFTANIEATNGYPNGIFWCHRPDDVLHPNVKKLSDRLGGNFALLPISQFDDLMTDLNRELRNEDRYLSASPVVAGHREVPFDDQPMADATVAELDWDLALVMMRQYCEKLSRPAVTRETLPSLLREQELLVAVEGRDVPTVGCILLFGLQPQKRFPHATIAATICGKKRTVFDGNLFRQAQQVREWLGSEEVNPVIRVKRRDTHDDRPAYPYRALAELLMNLLVHRDYEYADCGRIDVEPGVAITFENPGNLPEAVARGVSIDQEGRFQPVPHLTALRNRALCDVFFGMSEMERAGTGLTDVLALAQEWGGSTEFIDGTPEKRFTARICQPTSSAGSTRVARHSQPTGVYVINALPFSSLPSEVSVVRLTRAFRDRASVVDLSSVGTFVTKGLELWSFVPLSVLTRSFGDLVDVANSGSPESTLVALRKAHYQMTPVREDLWEGRPAYVIGDGAHQLWIDKERLLFVRGIEPNPRDSTKATDIRFDNYVAVPSGWVSETFEIYSDGKIVQREEWSDVRPNAPVDPRRFTPPASKTPR